MPPILARSSAISFNSANPTWEVSLSLAWQKILVWATNVPWGGCSCEPVRRYAYSQQYSSHTRMSVDLCGYYSQRVHICTSLCIIIIGMDARNLGRSSFCVFRQLRRFSFIARSCATNAVCGELRWKYSARGCSRYTTHDSDEQTDSRAICGVICARSL